MELSNSVCRINVGSNHRNRLLPPATKLGQGYVFTRVCDSASVHAGILPTPCLAGVDTPPGPGIPLGVDTPLGTVACPGTRQPPGAVHAGRYGKQAGGKHPTGVHSC